MVVAGKRAAIGTLLVLLICGCSGRESVAVRFEVSLSQSAAEQIADLGLEVPIVGRAFAIVSRDHEREPRLSTGVTGVPLWGVDVRDFQAGSSVLIADGGESVRGYPLSTTSALPPGEYSVQAFLNVYTTFNRPDGHTIEAHLNSGAHQSPFRSPGNAYSAVVRVEIDRNRETTIELVLDSVIQPTRPLREGETLQQGNYEDTEWVKYVKIRSDQVSEFWGRDMYIGANVLLPDGYDENPNVRYPVLYLQGHSSGLTPVPWSPARWFYEGHTVTNPGVANQLDGFYEAWTTGTLPKFIIVTFRDANPYYDTSYSINSANIGPYGDAIIEELIPYLEQHFRIISEPWARVLAGRSTGGWEAAALMISYPDFFAGSWPWAPDPIDFRKNMQINIYEDENAYFNQLEWIQTGRPAQREIDGLVNYMVQDEYRYEHTVADKDRSGGQWAVWQAVYSSVGPDGYPTPLWDPETGIIDKEVADYWRENYDLSHILQRDWATLGPKLRGKLHFAVGTMDNYYLNEAVYLVQSFLDSVTNPTSGATFQYGFRGRHSWIGHSPVDPDRQMTYAEFITVISEYITRHAPAGSDTRSWKY